MDLTDFAPQPEQTDSLTPSLPEDRSVAFTTSGTAAFERILQLESLHGSCILFPAFVCRETFDPLIERYDLDPIFVDVDRRTRHLDVDEATRHCASVDAMVLVHAFGLPAPAKPWNDRVASRDDVLLIEDCARALGARSGGRPVGSIGDYAIYSLSKVTSLFTGGCLVSRAPGETFDLEPPAHGLDLVVKTTYDVFPWELPFRNQIASHYRAIIGDRGYSSAEYGSAEGDDQSSIRRLDPVNQLRAKRYLRRQFDRDLERRRSIARELGTTLEAYGFDLQPDAAGRVYHALSATAPGDRDALVEFLQSYGHAVRPVWHEPLGLEYAPAADYPATAELAERVVLFPIVEISADDLQRLKRDLERFYGGR